MSVRLDDCLELQQKLTQSDSQQTEAWTGRRPGLGINHFVKTPDGFLHKFGVFLHQICGCVLRLFRPFRWRTTQHVLPQSVPTSTEHRSELRTRCWNPTEFHEAPQTDITFSVCCSSIVLRHRFLCDCVFEFMLLFDVEL